MGLGAPNAHPHRATRSPPVPPSIHHHCIIADPSSHLQHAQYQQAPQAQNHPPPAPHLDHRCDGSFSTHQRAPHYGAPQQVPTPPGPLNRAAPTTSINNESRGCFFSKRTSHGRVSILLACLVSTLNLSFCSSNAPRSNLSPPTGPSPTFSLIGSS
ncbi:hypothetical protein BC826DRAFT_1081799 [Russula brevipes]|nr:hypothetical protein BC826DRAFT_1081799 [Russula brevipes]